MPYIQTNINTSTQNEIEFSELSNMINGEVESAEIVLSPVAQNDCNLKLVWRAIYTSPDGYHICWIDAESGATLKIRDANDSAFNTQNSSLSASIIKEITTNENNISTPGPINIYEVSALTTESAGCNGLTNEELMSGSLVCPPGSGTHQQAALYTNITTVLGCLGSSSAPLGPIVYDTINIGHGCGSCTGSGSAVALLGSNTTVANFGVPSCQGARSLETLAHELGHAYLNEFFPSSLSNTHQGLHEFFADMFAMYAASLGCGDLDWTMGDEDSDANVGDYDNQDLVRNFNLGQEEGCFFSYSLDDDTFQAHDYANPLRKLSFLLATSVEGNGAPLFTFNEVMVMVMDALSVFPSDGSIFDFVNHIIDKIDNDFGYCSPESLLLRQSLNAVCLGGVFNGCQVNIGGYSTTQSAINGGPLEVCEESGFFRLIVPGSSTDANYHWSGLDPNWDVAGHVGGSIKGREIKINFYDYPYYPQQFKICVRAPSLQAERVCMQVKIVDCQRDDPDCEEYHNIDNFNDSEDQNIQNRNSIVIEDKIKYVKVFDLTGRVILDAQYSNWNLNLISRFKGQLIFISYLDENNHLLDSEKIFMHN